MSAQVYSLRPSTLSRWHGAVSHGWRVLIGALQSYLRDRRDRIEFDRLDDRTLRDLGIHRSEYASYYAEAHGQAERSRLHLTC